MTTAANPDYDEQIAEIEQEISKLQKEQRRITCKIQNLTASKENLQKQKSLDEIKKSPAQKWFIENFSWSNQLQRLLTEHFKFSSFRTNQLAAINAILSKEDVLVIMPTGGGKSLIYQMAAMVAGNLTVVVTPMISLMEDQLISLEKRHFPAAAINSTITATAKKEVLNKILKGNIKILFITPEQFAHSKRLLTNLGKLYENGKLDYFVIDEVHCCSQWGHSFRTDFQQLSILKSQYPGVPLLGLTATATLSILTDVQNLLNLKNPVVIRSSYNRDNLFYKVLRQKDSLNNTVKYISILLNRHYRGQSAIVYCGTQKESEDVKTQLRALDIKSNIYHAGMDSGDKTRSHKKWLDQAFDVMVATNAFGMGIDKSDVRIVIHYSVPKSLENFYQESGRAGRDGQPADCIMLYSLQDWLKNYALTTNANDEKRAIDVLKYCLDRSSCRRKLISEYFDDKWIPTDCVKQCDHCKEEVKKIYFFDITSCLKAIVQIVDLFKAKDMTCTLKRLMDAWFKNTELKPRFNKTIAEDIIAHLLSKNILRVKRSYNLLTVIPSIDYFQLPVGSVKMPYDMLILGLDYDSEDTEQCFAKVNVPSQISIVALSSGTSSESSQRSLTTFSAETVKANSSVLTQESSSKCKSEPPYNPDNSLETSSYEFWEVEHKEEKIRAPSPKRRRK